MTQKITNTFIHVKEMVPKGSRRQPKHFVARREAGRDDSYIIIQTAHAEHDARKAAKLLQDDYARAYVIGAD